MNTGTPSNHPLAPLGLPTAIRAQAIKGLRAISIAATPEEALRAADRAEGFALGIETLRAQNPGEVEGLYLVLIGPSKRARRSWAHDWRGDSRRCVALLGATACGARSGGR